MLLIIQLLGNACRDKVIRNLKKRFTTIESAEQFFNIDYLNGDARQIDSESHPTEERIMKMSAGKRFQLLCTIYKLYLVNDIGIDNESFVPINSLSYQ